MTEQYILLQVWKEHIDESWPTIEAKFDEDGRLIISKKVEK